MTPFPSDLFNQIQELLKDFAQVEAYVRVLDRNDAITIAKTLGVHLALDKRDHKWLFSENPLNFEEDEGLGKRFTVYR